MMQINIDKALKFCDQCIVNSMCGKSCENFEAEVTKILTKKISSKYTSMLSDEIRNIIVNNPSGQKISLTVGDNWFKGGWFK